MVSCLVYFCLGVRFAVISEVYVSGSQAVVIFVSCEGILESHVNISD